MTCNCFWIFYLKIFQSLTQSRFQQVEPISILPFGTIALPEVVCALESVTHGQPSTGLLEPTQRT